MNHTIIISTLSCLIAAGILIGQARHDTPDVDDLHVWAVSCIDRNGLTFTADYVSTHRASEEFEHDLCSALNDLR